jgi:tetratricopeptide (TPR) repeat protein
VAALDPLSWNAFSNLANYFLGTGFPDEAGAAVEKSIELNPHSELTQFILGKVRLDQRRPDDALTAFQRMSGAMRLMGSPWPNLRAEVSKSQMKPCASLLNGTRTTTLFRLLRLAHTDANSTFPFYG